MKATKDNEFISAKFFDTVEHKMRFFKCIDYTFDVHELKHELIYDGTVYSLDAKKYMLAGVMPFEQWTRYCAFLMDVDPEHMATPLADDDFEKISSIGERLIEGLLSE